MAILLLVAGWGMYLVSFGLPSVLMITGQGPTKAFLGYVVLYMSFASGILGFPHPAALLYMAWATTNLLMFASPLVLSHRARKLRVRLPWLMLLATALNGTCAFLHMYTEVELWDLEFVEGYHLWSASFAVVTLGTFLQLRSKHEPLESSPPSRGMLDDSAAF